MITAAHWHDGQISWLSAVACRMGGAQRYPSRGSARNTVDRKAAQRLMVATRYNSEHPLPQLVRTLLFITSLANKRCATLIRKIVHVALRGAGLLCALTIGLRAVLELFYFDSPRQPDPATGRTVPYVVKNVIIYVTENLNDVFHWLQWGSYFFGAVILVSGVLSMIWPIEPKK
jgi:hypothetical protein